MAADPDAPAENPIPLDRRGFEQALRDLMASAERSTENPGSYRGKGNERCFGCMFTSASRDCYQCTYCDDCTRCSGCTHCRGCEGVHASSYCVGSTNCSGCKYVVKSQNCFDCVFCFGCVGLVKKEFHILNQKFRRDEYFRLLETLEKSFGLKR